VTALPYVPGVCSPVVQPLSDVPVPAETITGSASLTGAGSDYAAYAPALTWSPGLDGPVTRPLTFGSPVAGGAAPMAATGTLAASGEVVIPGTASAGGAGTLSAAGDVIQAVTFVIALTAGDNSSAPPVLAPPGWTPLHTVTAGNGADHTGDVVLSAACTSLQVASATVTATASASQAMSGMMLGLVMNAPDPRPPGINPNWAYVIWECAFGSGYQTPPDAMEWVNLQTLATGFRCRRWDETTGAQYELDALESSELELILDNPDGYLSPENPSSPYYPHVVPGTPCRLRVIPPAAAVTPVWMIVQRNVERWPQSWDDCFRGIVNAAGNDQWSGTARALPTCYRAEVIADATYAWWPCDDPALVPLPVTLVNAAPGNSSHLQIVTSPAGLSATLTEPFTAAYSAVQDFAADSGWMYGDPVSAAWQQSGNGSGATGRYLACYDPDFPPLSGGTTIEWWGSLAFLATGSGSGSGVVQGPYTQPPGVTLTLWEIASATAPLAALQVTASGALVLTTWTGSTPASHVIYSAEDVRNATWTGVTVTLTQSSWAALVNGGVIASASGPASMDSAWSWFLAGAGTGNAGAPPAAETIAGSPNCAHAHIAVYPRVLPAARIMAHFMAAYAGFGQLPAPALTAQFVETEAPEGAYAPDGNIYTGGYFGSPDFYQPSLAAEASATGGGLTSGPAVPESVTIQPPVATPDDAQNGFMWLTATGDAVPAYTWFTSEGAGAEQQAAVTLASYLYVGGYGSGAAMPQSPSALGDTAQNRIERLLQAGNVTTPQRCIDAATSPMVAEIDTGGQACGTSVSNIAASDGGLLYIDACGNLCYFSRPHLAGMTAQWILGEDTGNGEIPYEPDATWDTDPQQVRNDIAITQSSVAPDSTTGTGGTDSGTAEQTTTGVTFAPDGSRWAAVQASQAQNNDQQYTETSYLQNAADIQARADWLFDTFGTPRQRITGLTVDAASKTRSCPAAWVMVFGASVGDIVQATRRPPGQPSFSGQWRISQIHRIIDFSAGVASINIVADVLPSYYPA
jgi:hypothetical protein